MMKFLGGIKNYLYEKRFGIYNALYNGVWFILNLLIFLILLPLIDKKVFYKQVVFYIEAVVLVLVIVGLISVVRSIVYSKKIYKSEYAVVKIDEHLILKCGMPGTCKTLTAVNQSLLTADCVWGDLVKEYWELSAKTEKQFDKDDLLKKRWRIVKRGYEFWSNFEGIKCFASNIPVERNGQFGVMVSREMLDQREWLPPFCVCLVDEIGTFCTLKESMLKNKNYLMEDMGRFSRHFEYWFIYTEQQPGNFTKSLRNVVGLNELMSGAVWLLRPKFLLSVCNIMQKIGFKFNCSKKYIRVFSKLSSFAKSLGYFSINSKLMGNMELGGATLGKQNIKTFHTFEFKYDSKCFSTMYQAKDKPHIYYQWFTTSLPKTSPIIQSILSKYDNK